MPISENSLKTLPWPFPRILAHRGSGTVGPENTLEGYRAGLRVIRDDKRSVPEVTAAEL